MKKTKKSGKVLYAIVNILLALLFFGIAGAIGSATAAILLFIGALLFIVGIICLIFDPISGIICILLGLAINAVKSSTWSNIAYIITGVLVVVFGIISLLCIPNHKSKASKILAAIYSIIMIVGGVGFLIKNNQLTNGIYLSSLLWIITTIVDVANWDGKEKGASKEAISRHASASSYDDLLILMKKIAKKYSGSETLLGRTNASFLIGVEIKDSKVVFYINADIYNGNQLSNQKEIDKAGDRLSAIASEKAGHIYDEAKLVLSQSPRYKDYVVDIQDGNVNFN